MTADQSKKAGAVPSLPTDSGRGDKQPLRGGREYDFIVIGSGPAGIRAAIQGAKAGKKGIIVEEEKDLGGGCVHSGTLPSKSFRESVYRWALGSRGILGIENDFVEQHGWDINEEGLKKHRADLEGRGEVLPEIGRLKRRVDRVVSNEHRILRNQLSRNGVQTLFGRGRLLDKNTVEVSGKDGKKLLTGTFIFIATGSSPAVLPHVKTDCDRIFDSNSIMNIDKTPKSLVVLGGGIIGCEYASMFLMAGTKVHLVDKYKHILASVDREIANTLVARLSFQGMEFITETEAQEVVNKGTHVQVKLTNGRMLEVDAVLLTMGRTSNSKDLGLENLDIMVGERGLIPVDKNFRTSVPNIYAVGDVIGAPALASTSLEQGRLACCHAFMIDSGSTSLTNFPFGIYTIPEISIIGKTEEQLVKEKAEFVVGKARYRELARGQIVGDQWGLLKLCVDRNTLQILGVHIIGDNAAELIHIGQTVMALGGDCRFFIQNIFNYPTLAEAYKTAAFHAVNLIRGTTTSR